MGNKTDRNICAFSQKTCTSFTSGDWGVQIALGHCSLLEGCGLVRCLVLLKLFRLSVEQALDNMKWIEESIAALATADDWELTYSPTLVHLSEGLVQPWVVA